MPKNHKKKKNSSKGGGTTISKQLVLADAEQTCGIVLKSLGDRHFTVKCQDGLERLCRVRGKMKNRQWVKESDIVLVGIRDFDDKTGDIIEVYTPDHVHTLKKLGELTVRADNEESDHAHIEEAVTFDNDPINFDDI